MLHPPPPQNPNKLPHCHLLFCYSEWTKRKLGKTSSAFRPRTPARERLRGA